MKKQKVEETSSDIPDVLQGEIARLDQRFKVRQNNYLNDDKKIYIFKLKFSTNKFLFVVAGKPRSSSAKWFAMYSTDLLVGRSTSSMCTSSFGNSSCRLSTDSPALYNGLARVCDSIFKRSSKSSERTNHKTSETFLSLAIVGHLGNECPTGKRSSSVKRGCKFCAFGLVNFSYSLVRVLIRLFLFICHSKFDCKYLLSSKMFRIKKF